jgi:outer membrane protein OmpA-like peptidoglycan-associated protein
VNADAAADVSARAVGAQAYTVGPAIVFAYGRYAPGSAEGDRLIAHELGHVLQGTRAGKTVLRRQPQDPDAEPTPGADTAPEPPMSRADEIELSRSSSGECTGEADPLTLSLYNFAIDSDTLKPEHQSVLSELGGLLAARATVTTTVRAVGFTDSTGSEVHNLVLSQRRALSVRAMLQRLVSQHVTISYLGETNPVASNATVSGRSRNRRVDLRFATEPPAQQPPGQQPGPQPPGPQPPDGGTDEDRSLCDTYPLLCGIGVLPFLLPLVCLIAPEACAAMGCALLPELCLPPTPPPGPPKPPQEPPDPRAPHVTFIPDVRADNTPLGMPDRIGLRDPVQVTAVVVAPTPLTTPITVDVDGVSARAGSATVNGGAHVQITGTTPLEIRGVAMTAPGFGFSPFLQLGAWWSGTLVGASNRFAVSSIIQDWTVVLDGVVTTRIGHGFYARMDWASDSGAYWDLDECRYVELVAVVTESGGMAGFGTGEVSNPEEIETGDLHPAIDQHGTPHEYTRSAGHSLLKQLWRIRDMRSNGSLVASRNSGFEIERDVRRDVDDPRCWQLTVTKRGADVSVAGLSSHAGSGRVSHRFGRLNCEPPPTPAPPTPVPTPTPTPTPTPQQQIPPCDREELARRVNDCIEQAKRGAVECTLGALPPEVPEAIEYLLCLAKLRRRLLECDRRAKEGTHCQDGQNDGPRIAAAAGLPPPGAAAGEETG